MRNIKKRILAGMLAFTIAFTSSGLTNVSYASELKTDQTTVSDNSIDKQTKEILNFEKENLKLSINNKEEISENLPKTILANIGEEEYKEIEITWETKDEINEETVLITYNAKLVNTEYKLAKNATMPTLKCYIGNFDVNKDAVCKNCFEDKRKTLDLLASNIWLLNLNLSLMFFFKVF